VVPRPHPMIVMDPYCPRPSQLDTLALNTDVPAAGSTWPAFNRPSASRSPSVEISPSFVI